MMIWLLENSRPSKARIYRDMDLIDTNKSGTLDRIEWVAYLAAANNG